MADSIVWTVAAPPSRRRRLGPGKLALGLLAMGGAVLASGLVSARYSPAPTNPRVRLYYKRRDKPGFTSPDWVFAVWGPLYTALTVSGQRVWNAPRGRDRTRALSHWFGIQALNTLWQYLGFGRRRRDAMAVEAAVTVVNAAAYVDAARRVDSTASWLAAPYAGLDRLRGAAQRGAVAAEPVAEGGGATTRFAMKTWSKPFSVRRSVTA